MNPYKLKEAVLLLILVLTTSAANVDVKYSVKMIREHTCIQNHPALITIAINIPALH